VGQNAGVISIVFQFLSVLIFPISCALFSFFYSLYGSVLYVVGPLVLALYPAMGVGQLARTYLVNLFTFFGWGIIYAVFCRVMTAINADSMTAIFNATSFGSWFQGSAQAILLAVASIMYSLMILLIPFIAKRIVSGEIGSTMITVASTAISTATMAASAAMGMAAGAAVGSSGGPAGAGAGAGVGGGAGSSVAGASVIAGGAPAGMTGAGAAGSSGSAPPRPSSGGGSFAPANARETGNLGGWANLSPGNMEKAVGSLKQAPSDLQGQPAWRVGSPEQVNTMAASGDWSQGYANVAEATTPSRSSASPASRSRGGSFLGTHPGDSRVGRNWSHAAGWVVGSALGSGYRKLRSSFTPNEQEGS
jgi:hypothetical protein